MALHPAHSKSAIRMYTTAHAVRSCRNSASSPFSVERSKVRTHCAVHRQRAWRIVHNAEEPLFLKLRLPAASAFRSRPVEIKHTRLAVRSLFECHWIYHHPLYLNPFYRGDRLGLILLNKVHQSCNYRTLENRWLNLVKKAELAVVRKPLSNTLSHARTF
jgi:hypothetical protein